jgi:HK97 family phage major capsid protein
MTSLAKIDAKISDKRRAMAEQVATRQDLYSKLDVLGESIDSLEAVDEPTAEQAAELSRLYGEHKNASKQVATLADDTRKLEGELHALEAERADRVELNRQAGGVQPRQTEVELPGQRANEGGVRVLPATSEQLDHDLASFFRNSYIAKQHGVGMLAVCNGAAGDQYRNDRLYGAVTTTGSPHIIPENYVARLIDLLRPRTVVRSMAGVRNLPLLNGNLRIPRQSGASTANYVAEQNYIPLSTPTTDQITLAAKKLTVMVVESGEIMRRSNPTSDRMILNDILRVLAIKEDQTFLRATGSATVPAGLKDFADDEAATQVIPVNATVNLANVTADIGKLILALANVDTPMLNPYFLFHPRTERYLMDLRDGNGNIAFREMENKMLRGIPYMTTTSIPVNLGGDTEDSEIYLVDASELIIADAPTFELQTSMEAAYDDAGTVKAAFSNDSVVFRLITEHDTAIMHPKSVAYLSAVDWGA